MSGGDPDPTVRVEVLGTLRLIVDGHAVEVPGTKRRGVLALLALADDQPVSIGSLVDALWPDDRSRGERQALQSHISRLRRHLGPAARKLRSVPDGYQLLLDGQLDAAEARSLLAQARASPDPELAVRLLTRARALWRGPELVELVEYDDITVAAARLRHLWQDITDELIVRSVEAGRPGEVVALAAEAVHDAPLREAGVLALVRALAANGDAAEALRAAHDYRRRLADETGLDPSPAVVALERDVASGALAHVPARPAPPGLHRSAARLVGRDHEVAELTELLARERLVTLTGPGGVGKTRLAQAIVEQADDAVVVPLSTVSEPGGIPHLVAAALGMSITRGDVLSACIDHLADRACLVVVDNCEHLLGSARDVVHLVLSRCPEVRVLATSREPLGLPIEAVERLSPLALPDLDSHDTAAAAAVLFLERAGRVRPARPADGDDDLAMVNHIVRRLDGLPLAIELAAGRLSILSIADLHARLDRSLDLLSGPQSGADARHRTLRATLEWSHELLSDDEQRLFRNLAVFPGGVDLGTAESIARELGVSGDPVTVLGRLVDASMIELDPSTPPRYRMLEITRLFGRDRLHATDESFSAELRLVRWGVELTRWIDVTMSTPDEVDADARLRREMPNLRAAWRTARRLGVDHHPARSAAVSMIASLFDAIAYRDLIELRTWAGELAADETTPVCPRASAAFGAAAEAAYHDGELGLAVELARTGLTLAVDADDAAACHLALASVSLAQGDLDAVRRHAQDVVGHRRVELGGVEALATLYAGNANRARVQTQRAYATATSPTLLAWRDYILGEIADHTGDADAAEEHYLRAIAIAGGSGATFVVGVATVGLLTVRTDAGRLSDALTGYRDVIGYFSRTGNWTHQWVTLRNLADLLRTVGCHDDAALIESAADTADGIGPVAPAGVEDNVRHRRQDHVLEHALRLIDRLTAQQAGISRQNSDTR